MMCLKGTNRVFGLGRRSVCLLRGSYAQPVWEKRCGGLSQVPCKPFLLCCYFPCHWCAGGITLNIKWLEGVFYAVLNICTAMNMPHPGALQLLNDLFLSVHFEGCEKDGESCPKFKLQDFVSEVYANNLSQER